MKKKKEEEEIEVTLKQFSRIISKENKKLVKDLCEATGRHEFSWRKSCRDESLKLKDLSKYLKAAGEVLKVKLRSGKVYVIKFK
jgi:predicted nucleic-acid-binding Zn-ribbon protein